MNIYGDNLISGHKAKLLNIVLIILGIALLGWNISIWMTAPTVQTAGVKAEKKSAPRQVKKGHLRRTAYNKIVTEDLFRSTRRPYVAPITPKAPPKAVQSVAPLKAPNLTLLGTIILNKGNAAVISQKGKEDETRSYRVGESIAGFKITEITEKEVLLSRGNTPLRIVMNDNTQAVPAKRRGWPSTTRSVSQRWPNTAQK